ncbi:gamma-glutamyl hydrolase [Scaptodrosophila lebanonensis]|uniref:folate gamma-glutamyl hydrolase n=1 Tax=Drosophila lebanonensis TaxID=7225 RepID=A0A6J2UAH6_DROLE|nr:gamma-glutamyl hydrolase [Scaptodrosophila lebanonensis]
MLDSHWPLLLLLPIAVVLSANTISPDASISPIIGVLSQEIAPNGLLARNFKNKTSYIAASYVKFLEGAGARVVPIGIGRNRSYYEDLMQKINGVLLPGGATWFNQSNGYSDAGEHLINIAIDLNNKGVFMPIWGTCLGMELLVYKLANGTEARTDCSSIAQPLPLEFKADFNQSRLFNSTSDLIMDLLKKENVTINSHRYCYTEKTFEALQLYKTWRVMTLNHDWDGIEFISTIEHVRYPFYAVQFHPEKPLYEFNAKGNIPHTQAAVSCSQFFAEFFVNEARRNPNIFKNQTELSSALIYNYSPEYTSPLGSAFVQQYLFEDIPIEEGGDEDEDNTHYFPYNGNGNGADAVALSTITYSALAFCLWVSLHN